MVNPGTKHKHKTCRRCGIKSMFVKPSSGFSLEALGPYLFAKAEVSLHAGQQYSNEDSATEGPHITHMGCKAMKELVYRAEVSPSLAAGWCSGHL